jgi:hypothetical protein
MNTRSSSPAPRRPRLALQEQRSTERCASSERSPPSVTIYPARPAAAPAEPPFSRRYQYTCLRNTRCSRSLSVSTSAIRYRFSSVSRIIFPRVP